jgi:hypothetical protein
MPTGNFSVVVKRSDTSAPIGGAAVTLLRLPPLAARTDASGVAAFENLEAGPVTIAVAHPAFRSKEQAVTVQPDQTSFITLALDPATDVYFAIYYKVKEASRGWTPAEVIAKAQRVRTIGQAGYAYFSQNYTTYVEWHPSYPVVYLWAYHRAKNGLAGGGERMPGKEFRP